MNRPLYLSQILLMMENYRGRGIAAIKLVNNAFICCLDNYNLNHEHEGINKQRPADLYTEKPLALYSGGAGVCPDA
jgi:hypothetical protein